MTTKPKNKNSKIIDSLLGTAKEPSPRHDNTLTQIELINVLNWYRAYGDDDKLTYYLHVYASNMDCEVTHLHDSSCTTYGALVRAMGQGFNLRTEDIKKLKSFCTDNHKASTILTTKQPTKEKPKKIKYLEYVEDIEHGLDAAITGNDYIHNYEKSKTNIKKCIEYIDNLILSLEVDYKDKALSKDSYSAQTTYLVSLRTYYSAMTKSKSTHRISSNKTSIVKSVKFDNSSKHKFISKPVYPIDIIGKKKLYAYDMKKGKLSVFISVAEGFTFSGTTLKNINDDKSSSKSFKKTEQLSQQISELNNLYKDINRKELASVTRFNEDTILLAYS